MSAPIPYDVIVIGSGPGGQKAAVQAAKAGRKVAIIERERALGGACVYHGTIPSKTLREAAMALAKLRRSAAAFQIKLPENIEVASLMTRMEEVVAAHGQIVEDHLKTNRIDRFHGRASFAGPKEIAVGTVRGKSCSLQAPVIVIASGSRPRVAPGIPVDHENILDSDSILSIIYLPRTLTVLGGGVIACEYASIFALLGVAVTLIDKAPRPLMFLEAEMTDKFVSHFQRHGGRYLGGCQLQSVAWNGVSQVATVLESGETILSDKLLAAVGRAANVEGLGLERAGIALNSRGHIPVTSNYETVVQGVYAVGDVIGPPSLAACSMEQGRRAICHALGLELGGAFEIVPLGIYAVPELASVGLTEEQARQQYGGVTVGRAYFEEIARGQISGAQDGMLKLVADSDGRRLLGVQIVGDGAADLIHVGEMALLNGNHVSLFLENILNFPTMGEAYRVAALNLVNAARGRRAPREAPVAAIARSV